ncbi:oligosaccharide flippase family protein [Vibrio scophthalmi]|uniref:oligosaccharide flippase family protein n=1 Tax=Vibrio scophthalmi TaxID=45658 RepID=UPI003AABDAD6
MLRKFNAIIYLLANVSVALVPFLLMPILTRYLGPSGYGQISMFQIAISFSSACIGLSTHGAVGTKWYKLSSNEIKKFISNAILLNMALFFVFLFVSNYFQSNIETVLSITIEWFYFSAMISFFNAIILIRLIIWQMEEQSFKYALIQVLTALTLGGLSYLLVVFWDFGADGRVYAHLCAYVVFFLISLLSLMLDGYIRFEVTVAYLKDALKFGVPLIPHVIGGYALSMVDRIMINKYLGLDVAGAYMVYVQVSLCLYILSDAFNKALLPMVYKALSDDDYNGKIAIVRISYGFLLFLILCVFVAFLIGNQLIELLAGNGFILPKGVLAILVLGQAFQGMYFIFTNYLFYNGKTYLTAVATCLSGVFGCGMIWLLINSYGVYGAAIGQASGMLSLCLLTWFFANKVYPMPWFDKRVIRFE